MSGVVEAASPQEPCSKCGRPFQKHDSGSSAEDRRTVFDLCDGRRVRAAKLHEITRAEAAPAIRASMLARMTPDQLLDATAPDFTRWRNYEIESALIKEFGDDWIVAEWCPFNGVYCRWGRQQIVRDTKPAP